MHRWVRDFPHWRSSEALLIVMSILSAAPFALWMTLLNNFAIERAAFTGIEMGWLQGVREIPGFLSFAVIYVLFLITEQRLAMISLALLALGTAMTGLLPSFTGLLITTTIMSIGFHYFETVNQSLALQWLPKGRAPMVLGRMIAAKSFAGIVVMAMIWLAFEWWQADFAIVYLVGGGIPLLLLGVVWYVYPQFPQPVEQRKRIVLRGRYWLYYALTFLSGARRQIFVVFAGFLLVERFGYSVAQVTALYILNDLLNIFLAPTIGRMISRFGERLALTFEYIGLIGVFTLYAFVSSAWFAGFLYVVDHLFFAMAIAIKTYFQKIGDPADMAPTAAVSFTINHIAAVFVPVLLGFVWIVSPAAVFLSGTAMAVGSLILARMVPSDPKQGHETIYAIKTRSLAEPAE